MPFKTDIDIDIANRDEVIQSLPCIRASEENGKVHPSGVYFQTIPSESSISVFDYQTAQKLGYFKIDLLSSRDTYQGVLDENHIDRLLAREVDWSLFEEPLLVEQLFQIKGHFGIVQFIRPRSIDDLAVILALIRGGKRYLMRRSREEIDREIWTPSEEGYFFKRAHAIAAAHTIVVQANLMYEKMEDELRNADGSSFS